MDTDYQSVSTFAEVSESEAKQEYQEKVEKVKKAKRFLDNEEIPMQNRFAWTSGKQKKLN